MQNGHGLWLMGVAIGCEYNVTIASCSMLTVFSGLVFYLGSVPVLSLTYAVLYLALLHFDVLPSSSVAPLTSTKPTITLAAATFLFTMSVVQFIWWLGQASLCTACEMAPVLAGHQGQVPRWCPQSRFVDKGVKGLPDMLATLAVVKDSVSWGMVLISLILVECARRQWARARLMDGEIPIGFAADYETGWKASIPMAGSNQIYEMGSLPKADRALPRAPEDTTQRSGYVEIGPPPSRKPRMNASLDVGMGYESRL